MTQKLDYFFHENDIWCITWYCSKYATRQVLDPHANPKSHNPAHLNKWLPRLLLARLCVWDWHHLTRGVFLCAHGFISRGRRLTRGAFFCGQGFISRGGVFECLLQDSTGTGMVTRRLGDANPRSPNVFRWATPRWQNCWICRSGGTGVYKFHRLLDEKPRGKEWRYRH